MTIRFIGLLLCSGLLVFAVTTGAVAEEKGKKQTSVDGKAGIDGHPDSKVGGSVMMSVGGAQTPAVGLPSRAANRTRPSARAAEAAVSSRLVPRRFGPAER